MSVHFSSLSVDWATPRGLFMALDDEFHFDFDPCSLYVPNALVVDGLTSDWGGATFCNPPYGRHIGTWIRKAFEQASLGKTVVLLIPSRTDTKWWHDYVLKASEIRFIRGRLYFNDGPGRAPFPSAVVVFK